MKSTYIIGEIGQNHNGSVDIAKQLIDAVTKPAIDHFFGEKLKPINAIKLTKRDLNEELSASSMLKPYTSPHSFGKTYGEHRAFLELNDEQHFEIYKYAKSLGLEFVETICARGCLSLLNHFTPDRLKVASRDLTNLPLLAALAEPKIPMILSTGMGGKEELDRALEVITRYHSNVSILHCLSQYPAEYPNINLHTITYLKKHYPDYTIGYSDHSIGIVIAPAAVAMGAEIIEKHITLDRNMKGTDHSGSLGVEGIERMVRDIRNVEMALGENDMFISEAVASTRVKLERSLATLNPIEAGEVIKEENLHMLSPGDGYTWNERSVVMGQKALKAIPSNEIIYPNMITE